SSEVAAGFSREAASCFVRVFAFLRCRGLDLLRRQEVRAPEVQTFIDDISVGDHLSKHLHCRPRPLEALTDRVQDELPHALGTIGKRMEPMLPGFAGVNCTQLVARL